MTDRVRKEWPGHADDELELRRKKEKEENERVLKQRAAQDPAADAPQPAAPTQE